MAKPEYNPLTGKFETDEEHPTLRPSDQRNHVRIAIAGLVGLTLYQKQQLTQSCEDLDQLNVKLENGEVPGLGSNDPSAGGDMKDQRDQNPEYVKQLINEAIDSVIEFQSITDHPIIVEKREKKLKGIRERMLLESVQLTESEKAYLEEYG